MLNTFPQINSSIVPEQFRNVLPMCEESTPAHRRVHKRSCSNIPSFQEFPPATCRSGARNNRCIRRCERSNPDDFPGACARPAAFSLSTTFTCISMPPRWRNARSMAIKESACSGVRCLGANFTFTTMPPKYADCSQLVRESIMAVGPLTSRPCTGRSHPNKKNVPACHRSWRRPVRPIRHG